MTAIAFSDCIRSTPSRTIGALLAAVLSQAGVTLVRERPLGQGADTDDRTLADIRLPRSLVAAGASVAAVGGLPN